MARLSGALNWREVAFAELAVEQIQRHSVNRSCGGWVVSSAFVPHERMSAVEFVPAEICSGASWSRVLPPRIGLSDTNPDRYPTLPEPHSKFRKMAKKWLRCF
jgi:hypothetical protein